MLPLTTDPALNAGAALLDRVRILLDLPATEGTTEVHAAVALRSRLATAELAWASVASALLAAGRSPALIDPHRVATAYRSDRVLSIDGVAPPVWSPYSGFWRTADGWVRTHGNYPHHSAALRTALGLQDDADADAVRAALEERTTADAVAGITRLGGLAVAVAAEDPTADRALRATPLLEVRRTDTPARRHSRHSRSTAAQDDRHPLAGMRVLDLTRVIAGPVCTRTLALLGADVLRIDPPHLPEPEWQHLDTGHGKRSAWLDARTAQMHDLLSDADAVVLGYRPAALDRLGLHPSVLAERYPDLVVAQLSAWGTEHPDRAGFDSLVQAASGIALIESPDGDRPGTLPAQALDHSAGYLLAAAVTALLQRRTGEGGSWYTGTSLRRIAAELLGMPRSREPEGEVEFDVGPHLARFEVDGRSLVTSRPAMTGLEFDAPHLWGSDQAIW
ncbi:CoA transferase [Microbacterium sp.]|uniref:CoA transferase n=1 Tax=Microbacterium sp. TaxID=51671 RepID=UPI003A932181